MTVEKNPINGAWSISDVIDNRLVSMQYFYYTKAEAIAEFNSEMRGTNLVSKEQTT